MPPPSRAALRSRYERLISFCDTELYVAMETLHVHPSELALPAPSPRAEENKPSLEHLFSPFGMPPLAKPQRTHNEEEELLKVDAPLGTDVLRSILAVAGQGTGPYTGERKSEPKVQQNEEGGKQPPGSRDRRRVHHRQRYRANGFPPAASNRSDCQRSPEPQPSHPGFDRRPPASSLPQRAQRQPRPSYEPPRPSQPAQAPQSAFRTARSRLPAKRLLRGGGARASGPGRGAVEGGSDGGNAAAMAATRAVLTGAKRARFSAPRARDDADVPLNQQQQNPDVPEVPNVEPKLVEMIMNEMLDRSPGVDWDDIAGLHFAKQCVMEAVVWPMKRPDIFTGLRGPPKGLLLFGPPGTGKTLIGRAIASKSGAKFFNISASSLMSKWVGEGEKMVRALFAVAREFQPSVVFIDEIDSLLTQRTDGEQESTRRVKTEFLVQMDGAGTSREDRVLVVGATNRPQELDEAARRRLVKRLYIPLPDAEARSSLVSRLLQKQTNSLSEADIASIAVLTKGYSGSDMYALCAEAALGPVRDLGEAIGSVDVDSVRPVAKVDFEIAVRMVRASVSDADLKGYVEWNDTFGSFPSADPPPKKTGTPAAPASGK